MNDAKSWPPPGFGPKRLKALRTAGIGSPLALLHCAPQLVPAATAVDPSPGQEVRFLAVVERLKQAYVRRRGAICTATLRDRQGHAWRARWFKAPWIAKHLQTGASYAWQGRCGKKDPYSLAQPRFSPVDEASTDGAVLRYENLPEGIGERLFRQAVAFCLEGLEQLADPLGRIADYGALLADLHQAEDPERQEAARRAAAERELIALHLAGRQRREQRRASRGRAWVWSDDARRQIEAAFPFTLRDDQRRTLAAIRADCAAASPMQRLLQGEVGSGKTAVALAACLGVAAAGGQSLLLAPTAILAEQHAGIASDLGAALGARLLTTETAPDERLAIRADLAERRCRLLIGTHALLFDQAPIPELALVVIDEQQRFGVEQRRALDACQPGWQVDRLLLTATPIPRSLAGCLLGDSDFDRLDGRQRQVSSEVRAWPPERARVHAHLAALAAGDCALVVVPRREDDDGPLPGCEGIAEELSTALPDTRIATLHGGDDEQRKTAVLRALRAGEIDLLVATTVIEVGLDLPQAALLVVLHAERYGLAQLHQLRGRVGRDGRPGRAVFCHADPAACERLQVLVDEDDGLVIAERDLQLRGPGELAGTRQHGLPVLRCADLRRDQDLLHTAATASVDLAPEQVAALLAIFPPS